MSSNSTEQDLVIEAFSLVANFSYEDMKNLLECCDRWGFDFQDLFYKTKRTFKGADLFTCKNFLKQLAVEKLNRKICNVMNCKSSDLPDPLLVYYKDKVSMSSNVYNYCSQLYVNDREVQCILADLIIG